MAYFLDNYPVSEECSDLVLTEEQEKYCRVVYKLDEEGGAVFSELWDPEAKYSDEYVIVPLRSIRGELESIPKDTRFANVIGSGADPKVDNKTWLKLWIDVTKTAGGVHKCCTDGNFYYVNESGKEKQHINIMYPIKEGNEWVDHNVGASCNTSLVGGHIILGTTAATPSRGNENVFIVPICDKHNRGHTEDEDSWGAGFYMKMKEKTRAARLVGYLCGVKKYIEEFKDEVRHE